MSPAAKTPGRAGAQPIVDDHAAIDRQAGGLGQLDAPA